MSDSQAFQAFVRAMDTMGQKLTSLNWLMSIRDAFVTMLPIIITGSVGILFSNVVLSPTTGLAQFDGFEFLANWQPIFAIVQTVTMGMISLYLTFLIAYKYSQHREVAAIPAGMTALAVFMLLIPTSITQTVDGVTITINQVIHNVQADARGMFLAIMVGIFSTMLLGLLGKAKWLKIRLPESVPPNVATSFDVLFPIVFTVVIFSVIGFLFRSVTDMYVSQAIFTFIQTPLHGVMQFPAGVIVLTLVAQLLWSVGIHGATLTGAIRNPIGLAAIQENAEYFMAGLDMPNVFTTALWDVYAVIGGSGSTVGLLIAIFLFSKRKDLRAIAKLSAVPALFGINEPVIFGMPIVLNPILIIPFILAPIATISIAFFAISWGIGTPQFVVIPWTTPMFLDAWLTSGGAMMNVVIQIVAVVVSTLIYTPFVIALNRQENPDEQ